jgi:hypothetical protein
MSPAATAASVIARPKPLFAPVISQTLFIMFPLDWTKAIRVHRES